MVAVPMPVAEGPRPAGKVAVAMTIFAAFGGFLYGYDTGYISGVKEMPVFARLLGVPNTDPATMATAPYVLTSATNALITSILSAGTFFGALSAYPAGDFLGRRFGIIAFLGLFCIGVALQTAATTIGPFAVGRVFAGLGVGGSSCLVPLYQSECAPKSIRGGIVSCYQWMITIGLLIASIVVERTKNINSEASYRIPIGLQFIWAFILGGGLLILPESPRWLLMRNREEDAQRSLARVLGTDIDSAAVNEEFAEIAASLHHERSLGGSSYIDCFRNGEGKNGLRTWTGIGLQALQQLTGINFIFYYGTAFFQNSGIENPFTITIATNVVNVGMTVPGILLVDRAGRRNMLLYGAIGMFVCQFIVAAVGISVSKDNLAGQRVLIAFVCIYIAHFAATWGPLAWGRFFPPVVTSEIYPQQIRGKCMSMSTASNWLLNFAIAYSTPYLVDKRPGSAGLASNVFWIWGGCCVLCTIFTFFCIPETRVSDPSPHGRKSAFSDRNLTVSVSLIQQGLSLEQVDILYRNSTPLRSNAFRKRIIAENIHDDDKEAYAAPKNTGTVEHKEEEAGMRQL
ncbi:BZ3500_MvSof-1268-A1-R1_Chr9g10507 [Microbotryum saponariae]|uniref:BZ3500_MvSof-1268-A1-R1_Chr9g10507 protein n=1 Tax=Microbotryum saponariae TaxID=289078 RepID=A0A2X0MEG2_9BASI|nr:BZ3501_MvSof-1269-A2-R1_Chr9g10256 [Microbotryum saponariae]SDA00213.1 BZ3500_MvSof-1268-A1-R1_Chr9g10507 [Microbotryum saponariae]